MKLSLKLLILLILMQTPILNAQQGLPYECGTEEDQSSNQSPPPNTICNNIVTDFKNLHIDDIVPQGIN